MQSESRSLTSDFRIRAKEENETEEMEHDFEDYDDSDSDGSSDEDSDDSEISDAQTEEEARRKHMCLEQMSDFEKKLLGIRDQLIGERLRCIDEKLIGIKNETASEYLQPLSELEENMKIKSEVSGILLQFRLKNIDNQYEAEELAAKQNFENEKCLLYDDLEDDLRDRIHRLEEDRNNVELNADLWLVERGLKANVGAVGTEKKSGNGKGHKEHEPGSRRKPITISGPYVVYMLREPEILEDYTTIKKALSNLSHRMDEYKPLRNVLSLRNIPSVGI